MYDISMLAKDQVLALINDETGLSLTFDQIEFGTPIAATGENPTRDTEMVISGIHNSGYKGSTTIFYNRIDLSEFSTLIMDELILQIEGTPTLELILSAFNALFKSNLQLEDLRDDMTIPTDIEGGVSFEIFASADSFAYRGSITMTLQPADVDIDQAIENKMLNGLTLNAPTEGGDGA